MFGKINKLFKKDKKKVELGMDDERFFIEDFHDFLRINNTAKIKVSEYTEVTGQWLRFSIERQWLVNYGVVTCEDLFEFHKWWLIGSVVTQKRGK